MLSLISPICKSHDYGRPEKLTSTVLYFNLVASDVLTLKFRVGRGWNVNDGFAFLGN